MSNSTSPDSSARTTSSRRAERAAFALGAGLGLGQVVDAEDHVLRRHGERQAVGRRKNVVRAEHQHRGFHLRFGRKRNVHGHLVAVEVRVERGADERMDANGLAFDEHGLERLNAEAVQRRSAVEQHGMLANHVFENVPDDGFLRSTISLACLMVVQWPAASSL